MMNPFVMLEDTIVGMIVFHNNASLGSISFESFLSLDGFSKLQTTIALSTTEEAEYVA